MHFKLDISEIIEQFHSSRCNSLCRRVRIEINLALLIESHRLRAN